MTKIFDQKIASIIALLAALVVVLLLSGSATAGGTPCDTGWSGAISGGGHRGQAILVRVYTNKGDPTTVPGLITVKNPAGSQVSNLALDHVWRAGAHGFYWANFKFPTRANRGAFYGNAGKWTVHWEFGVSSCGQSFNDEHGNKKIQIS